MSAKFSRWVTVYDVPTKIVKAVEDAADEGWEFEYELEDEWGWDEEENADGTLTLSEDDREMFISARHIDHDAGAWTIAKDIWLVAKCYVGVNVLWQARERDKASDEHFYTEAEYNAWLSNPDYRPVVCNKDCHSPYSPNAGDAPG